MQAGPLNIAVKLSLEWIFQQAKERPPFRELAEAKTASGFAVPKAGEGAVIGTRVSSRTSADLALFWKCL